MRRRFTWQAYTRPFHHPVRIKAESLPVRQGFWLTLTEGETAAAFAECAPLPGWHSESLSAVESAMMRLTPFFESAPRYWDRWSWTEPYFGVVEADILPFPSLQTAIEMLLLGEARWHRPDLFLLAPSSIPPEGSALVGDLTHLDLGHLGLLKQQGVRTVKVKIGRQPWARESQGLLVLRQLFGADLRLRLDLNQAWMGPDAEVWRSFLVGWPIDYIEDPGPDRAALPFTCAFDEVLRDREPAPQAGAVLVLKPNCFGLSRTIRWLKTGERAVLSNTYESRLSLQVYLWIYSRFAARPEALGLGTVAVLPGDFHGTVVDELGMVAAWPEEPFFSFRKWPEGLAGC